MPSVVPILNRCGKMLGASCIATRATSIIRVQESRAHSGSLAILDTSVGSSRWPEMNCDNPIVAPQGHRRYSNVNHPHLHVENVQLTDYRKIFTPHRGSSLAQIHSRAKQKGNCTTLHLKCANVPYPTYSRKPTPLHLL